MQKGKTLQGCQRKEAFLLPQEEGSKIQQTQQVNK